MTVVVLDTDVTSALLRGKPAEPISRQLLGQVPAVTFVTVGELTKWTLVRRWGPRSVGTLRSFLDSMLILPYDTRVAARWGELQAYAQLRGRPRPVNDTWIATCCLVRGLRRAGDAGPGFKLWLIRTDSSSGIYIQTLFRNLHRAANRLIVSREVVWTLIPYLSGGSELVSVQAAGSASLGKSINVAFGDG